MDIAERSGRPGRERLHLSRAQTASVHIPPAVLQEDSLQNMMDKGLMSSSRVNERIKLNNYACRENSCCVCPVFYADFGFSKRYVHFSVYTGESDNWCKFGRTRVTFDTETGQWSCGCKGRSNPTRCVHRYLCMWWIFQERQDLLMNFDDTDRDMEVDENSETTSKETKGHLDSADIIKMTSYLMKHKRIPEELSDNFCVVREVPKKCETLETICPYCPGPAPPELSPPKLCTKEAVVYGLCSVTKGGRTHNPFSSILTYSELAPWIGENTRAGDIVPKTEILKGLWQKSNVQKAELASACEALGVSTEGTREDILNRLQELLLYKDVYPKIIVKLQKAGGSKGKLKSAHSRVVGHKTPESGNHFILWVFDGLTSEIRLYDSLGKNKTTEAQDKELLCYKESAMRRSRIHHDRPVKPLDEAVFWIEYVMRNKGAGHLRVASHSLTWYQYHCLDVLVSLISILALVFYIIIRTCSFLIRRCCRTPKHKSKTE
ncbi:hypothetical protein MHYP_G00092330 [Metynnis hypsauchen]